jgi:hypothetical protein
VFAIPLAAGALYSYGIIISPATGTVLMALWPISENDPENRISATAKMSAGFCLASESAGYLQVNSFGRGGPPSRVSAIL